MANQTAVNLCGSFVDDMLFWVGGGFEEGWHRGAFQVGASGVCRSVWVVVVVLCVDGGGEIVDF